MRKILFATISFVALSLLNANAAEGETKKNVRLNIKLYPIQTLQINHSQSEVNLEYKTKEDYANGVSQTQKDHLVVYSTGAFAITAESKSDILEGKAKNIETNTVKLDADYGSNSISDANCKKGISLTNTATPIITSATGGVDKNFNITYTGANSNNYVNHYVKSENPTVYETTVTYTIIPQ